MSAAPVALQPNESSAAQAYKNMQNKPTKTTRQAPSMVSGNTITPLMPTLPPSTQDVPINFGNVLPTEIWIHIYSYLSPNEIERLKSVHRVCYGLSQARRWKTLQLGYFDEMGVPPNDMVEGCLENPVLAGHVRHLLIQEWSRSHQRQSTTSRGRISLWTKTHIKLPVKRTQQIWKSRDTLVDESLVVISHLTPRLEEMTINLSGPFHGEPYPQRHSRSRQIFYEQLFTLLAHGSLTPNLPTKRTSSFRFRSLTLKVQSYHLPLVANWLSIGAEIFDKLEQLSLDVDLSTKIDPYSDLPQPDSQVVERDIRAIITYLRKPVRKLIIRDESTHPLPGFIEGLGHFPELASLELACSFTGTLLGYVNFLMRHRKTLEHLCLEAISMADATKIFSAPPDSSSTSSQLPHLSTLGLSFRDFSNFGSTQHLLFRNKFLCRLSLLSQTLTTLVLDMPFHMLDYEDVRVLAKSLCRPGAGALLKRLKIAISELSPEIIDLFSECFNNLAVLDMTFDTFLGSKNRPVYSKPDFWGVMETRRYSNWTSLRWVDVMWRNSFAGQLLLELLARTIPSIQEFGPIDWSDVGGYWKGDS
ncbi:hypothetical protein BDN72DRAFT_94782 [Pluteus cervinus]|uniref:Uncharacterized protein n=1 Tax=Pluteus cervinus TaxID=181527 RepID=A0ACD3ANI9_9AGAR|nr:hypothetical protein BDN72DRAFT_94782 [Pluteus cervinus]